MCLDNKEKELLNDIPTMIMVTDKRGKIIFCNNILYKNLEYSAEQVINKNIINFVSKKDKEKAIKTFENFLKNENETFENFQIMTPTETRIIEIISKIREKEIFHTLKDITNLEKTKKYLKTESNLIKTMNKILSHDLTNSFSVTLSAIRIFRKINNIEKKIKMIAAIEKESRKGLSIINRLRGLRYTIENEQNLRIYDLKSIINNVANQSQIFIEIDGKGKALADGLLPNIFDNIFNNAIKHGNAGKINITIKENEKEQKTVVKIKNDGNPIEEKILPKIFQEGTKGEKTGNTGIGLSIVQKTMLRYGGYVKAKNTEEGVCFTLEFKIL